MFCMSQMNWVIVVVLTVNCNINCRADLVGEGRNLQKKHFSQTLDFLVLLLKNDVLQILVMFKKSTYWTDMQQKSLS